MLSENTSRLRVDCADVDCLLHALESHSKKENASDLQSHGQVDEDFAECCDLRLVFLGLIAHGNTFRSQDRRWDSEGTGLLQVLNCIVDVSQFRWLDSPTQDLIRLIPVPQLDLKDELFERAALHLRLRVLWHEVFEELFRAESEDETLGDTTCTPHPLFGGGLRAPVQLQTLTLADWVIVELLC